MRHDPEVPHHRRDAGDCRLGPAGHDGERACLGRARPAGDRCVDKLRAACRQLLGDAQCRLDLRGRMVDHHLAGDIARRDAARAERCVLHRRRVDHADEDDIGGLRHLGRARRSPHTALHGFVHPRGIGIVADDLMPGRNQPLGETRAHQPEPDEPDALAHGIPLMHASDGRHDPI